jgi:hypothetical protein
VAVRLSDSFVIDKLASAMQLFDEDDDDDEVCATIHNAADDSNKESTMGGTHFTVDVIGNKIQVSWWSTTEKHLLTYDTDVVTFIQHHYMSTENITTIYCCTEYMHTQLLMRCHPSYQGEGPWFDWVSVHFVACTLDDIAFPDG